jgi:hypothetical protein
MDDEDSAFWESVRIAAGREDADDFWKRFRIKTGRDLSPEAERFWSLISAALPAHFLRLDKEIVFRQAVALLPSVPVLTNDGIVKRFEECLDGGPFFPLAWVLQQVLNIRFESFCRDRETGQLFKAELSTDDELGFKLIPVYEDGRRMTP